MKNVNITTKTNLEVKGSVVPPNSRLKLTDKSYIIDCTHHAILRNGRISSVMGSISNVMSRLFYLLKEVETYICTEIADKERFVLYDKVLEINFVLTKADDMNRIYVLTIVDAINKNISKTGIKLFEGQKVIIIDNTSIDYYTFIKTDLRKEIDII